jgi:putative membrane protein
MERAAEPAEWTVAKAREWNLSVTDHDAVHRRPPTLPSDLGELRTIMAADRTLMAWIRTSLSMLSFGFTIYKFLQSVSGQTPLEHPESPRQVGLFLVGMGVAAIVLGTIGYWMTLKDLQRTETFRIGRPVLIMALIMSIAGVALFFSIAAKLV